MDSTAKSGEPRTNLGNWWDASYRNTEMSSRKGRQMKESLEHWVAPTFREKDFQGKFPILRRARGSEMDVVELQFSFRGGGFSLNLSVCRSQGIMRTWGKQIPPDEVSKMYEMARKYFLDPRNVNQDKNEKHWFELGDDNTDQVEQDFLPIVGSRPMAFVRPSAATDIETSFRRRSYSSFRHAPSAPSMNLATK